MLSAIFGGINALSGITDAINGVSKALSDARIAAINAKTEQERIAAEERVKTLEANLKALETRRDVLVSESQVSKANIYTRTFIALPIGILFWKLFVWDKALGQWTHGRTDILSPELWQVIMVVLGFYFLYEGAVGITRLIKQR